jgi:hypothetical protein
VAEVSAELLILGLRLGVVVVVYLFLVAVFLTVRRELGWLERGARQPPGRLVVVEGGGSGLPAGHCLPLQPVTTVGRSPHCTLVLNDTFVSGTHAVLTWRNGQWWVRDAGSTNGTLLNQVPVPLEEVPLQFGDVIDIGRIRLKLAA